MAPGCCWLRAAPDRLEEARDALPGEGHEIAALDVADERAWGALADRLEPPRRAGDGRRRARPDRPDRQLRARRVPPNDCDQPARHPARRAPFPAGSARRARRRRDLQRRRRRSPSASLRRLRGFEGRRRATDREPRAELARDGVRINAVAPGFVATRMHEATLAAGPESAGRDYFERTERDLSEGGAPASEAAQLVRLLLDDAGGPVQWQAALGSMGSVARAQLSRAPGRRARSRHPAPHRRRLLHGGRGDGRDAMNDQVSQPSDVLRPPSGLARLPAFDAGWRLEDGVVRPSSPTSPTTPR